MKLRIRENSVRIRLTQSEVAALAKGQVVRQDTWFTATQTLGSSIAGKSTVEHPHATFEDGAIIVLLPIARTREWADGAEVSIEAEQAINGRPPLRILVEKDFQCLHGESEGIADAFPNPRQSK